MRKFILPFAAALLAAGTLAAAAQTPITEGRYVDRWGTTFDVSPCGDDGLNLCATLVDIQGDSRTEQNLQYVGQQVINMAPAGDGRWEGTVTLNGQDNRGSVSITGADTIDIEGCRLIICNSISYTRQ